MIERKFIDLKSLKVSDEGSGTIEGYRSVFGEIDLGGDIVIKGAFADSMANYLHSGFTAHSHDWDFDKAVGFPLEAHEDDYGFFVKSQFHSTPDAQAVRTKAQERQAAGKQVGFSYGYKTDDFQLIEAKDFKDQLPQYIKADRLEENLKKAQQFPRIRIIKKNTIVEDSIVTSPMNTLAASTGVKSTPSPDEIKQFLESPDGQEFLKAESVSDPLESFDDVVAALEKQTHNMQRNHDNRTKEGRVLSTTHRAKVLAARDALNDLLAASEPKPKEKELDVNALRTQSLRMQSEAMTALA